MSKNKQSCRHCIEYFRHKWTSERGFCRHGYGRPLQVNADDKVCPNFYSRLGNNKPKDAYGKEFTMENGKIVNA